MVDVRNIRRSSEFTDRWLGRKQRKHLRMVENSILKLQNSIEDILTQLSIDKSGRVEGLRVNLKQAQQIHKRIENTFGNKFSRDVRNIINDFKPASKAIERAYSYLDIAAKFTSVDEKALTALRDGYYANWLEIGTRKKNEIVQGVYDQVIGNARFTDLVDTVRNALTTNIAGVPGKSLVQYSRLYARDLIMDYQRNVNLIKAQELGFNSFLYVGDIIATTRPFCKTRVGKVYTVGQINSWTYQWAGKKGPALHYCGGWNCRHHWQAVKPEWLKGKKKLDIGDWNLEQRNEALR